MDNKEIYKKTIGFSFRSLLWDLAATFAFFAIATIGIIIAGQISGGAGLAIIGFAVILGAIAAWAILHFFAYTYKAGQIAMMTEGVVAGKLPEDTISAGKKAVKERFSTVAAYYVVTGAIKGIFSQLGRGIIAIGNAVGGENGGTIGSAISSVINVIVRYLCDCCLGWVFYRKSESSTKATLEGAVLFFKHGKTLAKNLGRIAGISLVSLLVIGGVFMGISYLIFISCPDILANLQTAIANAEDTTISNLPEYISDITTFNLICSGIIGVIFWSMLHAVFVRPFILIGVLRNYINSGVADIPTEKSFDELDDKSKKFAKLHSKLASEQ